MAKFEEAISSGRGRMKPPKVELHSINLKKAENGGVIAEHRMSTFEGSEPVHAFGADEGHKLAAHLQEHLGIKMGEESGDGEGD